jgi:hypothetical protein
MMLVPESRATDGENKTAHNRTAQRSQRQRQDASEAPD